jgi:hypothetical protein
MDTNLMMKDDFENLGFSDKTYKRNANDEGKKEAEGFVAGLNVKGSNTWKFW